MRSDAQTAVRFDTNGRVIPVRIRYYDMENAEYVSSDIDRIYYEEREPLRNIYSVRLKNGIDAKLFQNKRDLRWKVEIR